MSILHWIVSVVAILIAAYLIPGVEVTLLGAIVLAVVLGVINIFVKPILRLLTLPLTILTLGLFSLVLNALLVMLAALIVPGFVVGGFWAALLFALLLSLINALFHLGRS
ncbi:MAG TPA: phage holin family protein [Candidatus Paceibacterota bacterium]|jgi:putative membrane protein